MAVEAPDRPEPSSPMIAQPISVGKLVLPRLDASKSIKAILFIAAGDIDIAAVAAEYSCQANRKTCRIRSGC